MDSTGMRVHIKIEEYAQGIDPQHLFEIINFFEHYGCCEDLIAPLKNYLAGLTKELADIKRRARQQFEIAGRPLLEDGEEIDFSYMDDPTPCAEREIKEEPTRPQVVIGFCPKCNSTMVGDVVPPCESEESGRHFYSECTVCRYYTEIFKGRKGRYIEIKGE